MDVQDGEAYSESSSRDSIRYEEEEEEEFIWYKESGDNEEEEVVEGDVVVRW